MKLTDETEQEWDDKLKKRKLLAEARMLEFDKGNQTKGNQMKLIKRKLEYKKFGELTDVEKTELVTAVYVDNNFVQYKCETGGDWRTISYPNFCPDNYYSLIKENPQLRDNLTIEFTPDECEVLAVIMAKIAGKREGPRMYADKLDNILCKNGFDFSTLNSKFSHSGTITINAKELS